MNCPTFEQFNAMDHSWFRKSLRGETEIPEEDGDPLLSVALQAMLRVIAPVGSTEEMPVDELPVFGTEHWDEIPRDHTVAGYGDHITQVALVRVAKAIRDIYRGAR